MSVTYRSNDQKAGAIPVDTVVKTSSTTDGEVQHITIDDALGNSSMDDYTGAVITVAFEHHEIHEGDHYYLGSVQDLALNEVLDFTLQTPNTTKWANFTWRIATEKETFWYIYEDAVATTDLANVVTPVNSNRNSTSTSTVVLRYELQANLAAANADTDVTGATLIDSGISGDLRTSGEAARDDEIILKQNTLYCMRAVATVAGYINFHIGWYEHTSLT